MVPAVLAIVLAILTRNVIFSLLVAIFSGCLVLDSFHVLQALFHSIDFMVAVFENPGSTNTVLFTLLVGGLIHLMAKSGGTEALLQWANKALKNKARPKRFVQLLCASLGITIFVESNISILTTGTIFRPLFDRFGLSRARLAYIVDSAASPTCIMLPLNAWGGYILGLLVLSGQDNPFQTLVGALAYNFYPFLTVLMVLIVCIHPSRRIDRHFSRGEHEDKEQKVSKGKEHAMWKLWYLMGPISLMLLCTPLLIVWTGWDAASSGPLSKRIFDSFEQGSGSQAVLYSVVITILLLGAILLARREMTPSRIGNILLKGINKMTIMAMVMTLAFTISSLCRTLGTGIYLASEALDYMGPSLLVTGSFIASAAVSFFTGTSWGAYAIMISIVVPMGNSIGADPSLMLASVMGGGVLGDHCSPISDTTVLSSLASSCPHMDHVNTQLPLALFVGGVAGILYMICGIFS